MAIIQHNANKIEAMKRALKDPVVPAAKRQVTAQNLRDTNSSTARRPNTSDSSASGKTAESKDEDYTKDLLNHFVAEVLSVLGSQGLELKWPASRYYISLTKQYHPFFRG